MTDKEEKWQEKLLQAATQACEAAYVPISDFPVGAAVMTKDGRIFHGCNIENKALEATMCAERVAIFNALSEGERDFIALAVYADTKEPISPCGACRQVMAEFSIPYVLLATKSGKTFLTSTKALLTRPFLKKRFYRAGN